MSNPIALKVEQGVPYIDRKKIMWLFSVIAPAGAALGPIAHMLGATSQIWFFVALAFFYLCIPLLDHLLGEDLSNPPESAVPKLEADRYYRRINYMVVPVLLGSFLVNVVFLGTHDLPWYSWLATVIVTGSMLGFGINLSHELGHKRDWIDRKIALFTAALSGYGHFSIEHNRGHHVHVATPEDPASSRLGENFYQFMCRELPGTARRAWQLEAVRCARMDRSVWSLNNEIIQGGLFTLAVYGSLIALLGWQVAPMLLLVAFWGALQLTSANYIEHYGLLRQKLDKGRFERCQPHHSWNSNHIVSNLVLFHLQRHSDHHANPSRSYQSLRNFPDLPTLPSGYFGMFLAAYVPPVWFNLMDKRVIQVAGNDSDKINFMPAKRERLIERYKLKQSSSGAQTAL